MRINFKDIYTNDLSLIVESSKLLYKERVIEFIYNKIDEMFIISLVLENTLSYIDIENNIAHISIDKITHIVR